MRQWFWTPILVCTFLVGIAVVLLWLYLERRHDTEVRLNAHQGRLDENRKAQENLELALKQNEEQRRLLQDQLAKLAAQPAMPKPISVDQPRLPADTEHLAKSRMEALKNQGKVVDDLLARAEKEVSAWEGYQKTLFQGDAGRRIAGKKDLVDQIAGLLQQNRPAESSVKAWRRQLKNLLDPVIAAEADEKRRFVPSDQYMQDLAKLEQAVKEFVRTYERDRQTLEVILAVSQGNPPAEKGLKQAIQELTAELAQKRATAIAELKQAAFDEATQKIAKAEAEAIRIVAEEKARQALQNAELETKHLSAKAAIEKSRIQGELEAANRQAAKDKLKRMAEDPNIQAKYQAFLTAGQLQFSAGVGGFPGKSVRPEHVSLGDLNRNGWLKDSKAFAQALSKNPMGKNRAPNDRPTNPPPRTAKEWEELDRMLEEFRVLAPVWVEMKLLRP